MRSSFLQANTGSGYFNLPCPSSYQPTYTHLENSYTNANGYLVRDIIRKNRAKVTCSWSSLNSEDMALLQSLYNLSSFKLRFTDNYGRRVEKKVYAGPLDGKTVYADKKTFILVKRSDVTMNFIEY